MKIKYLSILPIVAVLVLSDVAHAQSDVFTQSLYYGLQNNSQVTQLQEFLTSQNLYSGPITGNFYFLTLGAVKAFQTQQGITPAAGYFGPVTMAAVNKIADAEIGASNSQAISETGTSTPAVSSASTTPQLQLAALMQEVALLEQQLQAQQSSTQQQSQTLQQIAQNTTPPVQTVPTPVSTQPQASTPTPTARLTVNGSTNSITIPYGTAANISWSSTNASSCNISPSGWSGASGNQSTGNLISSQTYSLSCTGNGGSTSASLTVSVSAAPIPTTLGSIQLTGTSDGTNQFYTGVRDTNVSFFLFDQNGNPITTASATITTDNPLSSGVGWGDNGETEINNSPSGQTTFSLTHANISNPSSPVSMQHNNGYIFEFTPQTDGQHTITVSALGSTQSIIVTSVPPPPPLVVTANQNTNLGTQSIAPGTTNVEIGSYVLTAPSSVGGVNVNTVSITINSNGSFSASNLKNLKLMVNGVQFGGTQPTVSAQTYVFSGSPFNFRAGGSGGEIDVVADVASTATGSSSGGVTSLTGLSAADAFYETMPLANNIAGQDLTISSSVTQ